ncbi:MAG: hypothetical protein M1823_001041 [Watsoniomyces obsoletus]|nr:MAG: hypothetical protein M1823_001041 [Watsoniomyces obsoletus]
MREQPLFISRQFHLGDYYNRSCYAPWDGYRLGAGPGQCEIHDKRCKKKGPDELEQAEIPAAQRGVLAKTKCRSISHQREDLNAAEEKKEEARSQRGVPRRGVGSDTREPKVMIIYRM